MKILVINPGSTSTKIAIFENSEQVFDETIRHEKKELMAFETIPDQKDFRYQTIINFLKSHGIEMNQIDAVASRGGIIKPIESGTYAINEAMVQDLHEQKAAMHASCIAGLIGYDLQKKYNIPAYVVDPVVVDELQAIARLTGIPDVERTSIFHALNQKAIARECAKDLSKAYEDCNFVVAHMGGGISVAAHEKGRTIDVNNAISGEGPFSPERCGTVTALAVTDLIFNKGYTEKEIKELATKNGGMAAYLKTNDMRECEKMISEGNQHAQLVFDAMAYQVAKEIGSMAAALSGDLDAIVLTGGLAYSKKFTDAIIKRVRFMSEVKLYPGEFEMQALAASVLRVLTNEEAPKIYK